MREVYTYLWIDFFTIIIPFIFSFHPRIQFYRKWKYLFPALIITAVFFIIWDSLFTSIGVWHFNSNKITGIHIFNLPLEEVLFFIAVPYSCVFVYEIFTKIEFFKRNVSFENIIINALILILVILTFSNSDKLYTFITATLLASYLIILKYINKAKYLYTTFLTYLILLIPFLLVNGYLTGMFSKEAVVIYNNAENLGIRIFTIPIEDVLYGFLLFTMNISLYEFFKKTLYHR